MYVDEQLRIAPQKPNRRTPRARFSSRRGFRRHLISRCSVRAEVRDGEDRRLLRCGFVLGVVTEDGIWTDGVLQIYDCDGKRERGSGESLETEKRKRKGW